LIDIIIKETYILYSFSVFNI